MKKIAAALAALAFFGSGAQAQPSPAASALATYHTANVGGVKRARPHSPENPGQAVRFRCSASGSMNTRTLADRLRWLG